MSALLTKFSPKLFVLSGVVINALVKFSFELSTPQAEERLWILQVFHLSRKENKVPLREPPTLSVSLFSVSEGVA